MAFEVLLIAVALIIGVFFIGIPCIKLYRSLNPPKRNPLDEARERLEQARLEAEAARLNKEASKVYENLYDDVLNDSEKDHRRL